ncbi:MAG: CBS domain-containing protein, partial [Dehalococcoidia bacterium]
IAVTPDQTVREVMQLLQEVIDTEVVSYVYAVDHGERLVGVLSIRDLLAARPQDTVATLMTREVISADVDEDQEEVAHRARKYNLSTIPILDAAGHLVGVATIDDLVDEENSRTKYMRDKTRTWYYQTLEPTREPPDPAVPHRGEHHVLGTHYHFDDLYAHLRANELEGATLAIPAIDEKGRSAWASKFPVEWLEERKQRSGIIIFNAQFQVDTEAMKGEVFQYDDCQQIPAADVPDDLHVFMGADLAATEETRNDQFAVVVIGCEGKPRRGLDPESIYVLDYFAGRIRFSAQLEKIEELYEQWAPIRCGIEANAYQKTLYSELKHRQKGARYVPIFTSKDKLTRAWKLSAAFEGRRVFFKRNLHGPIIDQLVLFPNHRHDDLFDALDFAVATFKKRRRRKRTERKEPGLL